MAVFDDQMLEVRRVGKEKVSIPVLWENALVVLLQQG